MRRGKIFLINHDTAAGKPPAAPSLSQRFLLVMEMEDPLHVA
jgi:hypothetical protein